MKSKLKYLLIGFLTFAIIITIVFAPDLPWSMKVFFNLRRVSAKTGEKLSNWQGKQTKIISIKGKLTGYGAMTEALKGAQIIALESSSGYSSLSNEKGEFTIPHLVWYPGAQYNLVISASDFYTRLIKLTSPQLLSDASASTNILDFGEINFDLAIKTERSQVVFRTMKYDTLNHSYYKALFDELTVNATSDEEKISKINSFVASKLNYNEPAKSFPTPRAIIEKGSCYCSNLAIAMAAITSAANYPTRTIHLTDTPNYLNTHVVVEVYYNGSWHLYDPTYGIFFLNKQNSVASYRDLRLNPSLVREESSFKNLDASLVQDILKWMPDAFNSGFYQSYLVKL
ncbi:MAG: transglutaminase domain-containing protein [Acidobacteria bacterium]|nr:transglutaminase domain-containing protein [Acidobacteriota bacterium]